MNLPQNVYNLTAAKASSSFDHRHRVVVSFAYKLSLTRKSNGLMHRWSANGSLAGISPLSPAPRLQ
jgi:hypothetical protein